MRQFDMKSLPNNHSQRLSLLWRLVTVDLGPTTQRASPHLSAGKPMKVDKLLSSCGSLWYVPTTLSVILLPSCNGKGFLLHNFPGMLPGLPDGCSGKDRDLGNFID